MKIKFCQLRLNVSSISGILLCGFNKITSPAYSLTAWWIHKHTHTYTHGDYLQVHQLSGEI